MSHNVKLSGVKITDLDLLEAAIRNLKVANLKVAGVTLERNVDTFRTYSGQPNSCDHRINLPGPHDIGLKREPDGSYSMTFDPYRMTDVLMHDDAASRGGDASVKVSALMQEYGLVQSEYQAAQLGYTCERVANPNVKGQVDLVVYA